MLKVGLEQRFARSRAQHGVVLFVQAVARSGIVFYEADACI